MWWARKGLTQIPGWQGQIIMCFFENMGGLNCLLKLKDFERLQLHLTVSNKIAGRNIQRNSGMDTHLTLI